MSNQQSQTTDGQAVKTLAIRLEAVQHAQLSLIAQLADHTLTEEIRLAVEHWIERSRQTPEFAARAEGVIAAIERDAQTRRSAITALLGDEPAPKNGRSPRVKRLEAQESTD